MACREIEKLCQPIGARRPVQIDWTPDCINRWLAGEVRTIDEVIRQVDGEGQPVANGFQYRYSVGGQSGQSQPKFARTGEIEGATYPDGAATLTAELISNESLARVISTSEWPDVAGVTIDGKSQQAVDGEQKAVCHVSGSAAGTYRLRNVVTFTNGEIDVGEVDIEIE